MTLHQTIREVLHHNHNAWMTSAEIAEEIADRQRYLRGDGALPPPSQIHAQIDQYSHLFEVDRSRTPVRFRWH